MPQWAGLLVVHVMARHLVDARPLDESALTYSTSGPQEKPSLNFETKYGNYLQIKRIWKCGTQYFHRMWSFDVFLCQPEQAVEQSTGLSVIWDALKRYCFLCYTYSVAASRWHFWLLFYVLWDQDAMAHDDVIKWKHFPRYWTFIRGIHWSLVNSPQKGSDSEL